MSDEIKLTATSITDEAVIKQCKDAINEWSSKLPFAISRKLGDDGQFISAEMYHAYTFSIETDYAHREKKKKKGGDPVSHPTPIEQVDMWDIGGAELSGDYDVPLPFTCYREECEDCHGHGKVDCPKCKGSREMKCPDCGGRGEEKCDECGGRGTVPCPVCGGTDVGIFTIETMDKHGKRDFCRRCGGEGRVTCRKCGGAKTQTCRNCHGSGRVTCSKCKGRGEIVCSNCDGKGYIPYQYHLIQKQNGDVLELVWGDAGIPTLLDFDKYEKYPTVELFHEQSDEDSQVGDGDFPEVSAEFRDELFSSWAENFKKYDGIADIYIHSQDVAFEQKDAVICYKYKYNDKEYELWVDLTSGKVSEIADTGLMAEWSRKIAEDGDKYVGKNPQQAIYHYSMACAVSSGNEEYAKKMRKQLSLASWLFRLASGGVGGWLWSVFMGAQGADPLSGWYIMGAMIFLDILFAQKQFWLQLVAAGGVYGVIRYLLPYFYTQQIASDVYLQSYLMSSVLMFVGGTLLFARDFALRIRGGVLAFPILGALVGGATAPGMYLDFAENPELMVQIMTYTAYALCGLAILRTWKRYWVQNCGWIAPKVEGGLARFETNMLKPRFWPMAIHLLVFGAVGYGWYMYAGPGVGIEMKARVAERFLQNERTREKGKLYLSEAVKADYLPAISQMAEFQIMGKYGFAEDPKRGYELAVKAGDKGDAKAWRLQGFCLEHGKGQGQNLTAANARYAKAVELGDKESVALKEKTDEIAKVWEAAYEDNKEAQYGLAVCYANGNGIAKDEGIARQWLLKAADTGHVKSQLLASEWLIKGVGGAKDPETGVKYCEKAALQDDPEAIAVLGYYYFDGKIIPQDYPKAVESFSRACEKGSESAAYMLGYCYREGLGVETNAVKAFEYFKLADERKSLPGAYALGVAYENGLGVTNDYTAALGGYTRASEAEWEDPLTGNTTANAKTCCERIGEIGKYWKAANVDHDAEAQYHVGLCFANGTGVNKNLEKAYFWFVESAKQGYTNAIVRMADALYSGTGVGEDKAAAAREYERGMKFGDAHSTYRLGISYESGYGFDRNLTTAHHLYTKAGEMGYRGAADAAKKIESPAKYWDDALVKKDAAAQYALGCCFSRGGCGVEKDDMRAFSLYRESANQGYASALYMVYLACRDGVGTEKNEAAAIKAILSAAEKSHPAALAVVGDMYRDGRMVEQNLSSALTCYQKAADAGVEGAQDAASQIDKIGQYWEKAYKGDADAQFNLGICYRDGNQVSQDLRRARHWIAKSADQGNHNAEYALAKMLAEENPGDGENTGRILTLLENATSAGQVKAMVLLGTYLYDGKGVDENLERAIQLWQNAEKKGDLDAKWFLGQYYFTGKGMLNSGKDRDKAKRLWEEASGAGHAESSLSLAKLYLEGSGIFSSGKDTNKGLLYLRRAAEGGSAEAMKMLAEVLLKDESNGTNVMKKEGEMWLAKSTQKAVPKHMEFRSTILDSVESVASKLISDDAIRRSQNAAKALLDEETLGYEVETSNGDSQIGLEPPQADVGIPKEDNKGQGVEPAEDQAPVDDKEQETGSRNQPLPDSPLEDLESKRENVDQPVIANHVNETEESGSDTRQVSKDLETKVSASEKIFAEYTSLMHGKNKGSRAERKRGWEKIKGKELTLKAKMRNVKKKNGVAIIDCSVDGKNIVVEMRKEFIDEAMRIAQGTDFYVKGIVADKRWGILHVLGLTEGEIIK